MLQLTVTALLCASFVAGQSSTVSATLPSGPATASIAAPSLPASRAPILTPALTTSGITIYQTGVAFAPSSLPAPYARNKAESIFTAFGNLGRSTSFVVNKTVDVGEYEEAEGMVRVGPERYFISHIRTSERTTPYPTRTNGTDRTTGAGAALITVLDGNFTRIATINISLTGSTEWHNGGLDYDGRHIWADVSEYRPNSTFSLVRIDPQTLNYTYVARFRDHAGGPIHDVDTGDVYNLNWGSRNATVYNLNADAAPWPAFTEPKAVLRNPSYYVDYQDCKFLGRVKAMGDVPLGFCTGFALFGTTVLGGMAIVNLQTMAPVFEVPYQDRSLNGFPLTLNPSDVDFVDGHLRFYFLPDQAAPNKPLTNSTLYIVDALPQSPFQYGGGPAPV